jgi:hypothetical protein
MCRTTLQGWLRYKDDPDARVRERLAREAAKLRTAYNLALWATEKQFRQVNRSVSEEFKNCGARWRKNLAEWREWPRRSGDRSCGGRRDARKSGWQRERRTSHRCFWSGGIGGRPEL